jgi:hypothetical protein
VTSPLPFTGVVPRRCFSRVRHIGPLRRPAPAPSVAHLLCKLTTRRRRRSTPNAQSGRPSSRRRLCSRLRPPGAAPPYSDGGDGHAPRGKVA